MNLEFVDFLAARFDEIESLRSEIRAFKRELRNTSKRLANCINFDSSNLPRSVSFYGETTPCVMSSLFMTLSSTRVL